MSTPTSTIPTPTTTSPRTESTATSTLAAFAGVRRVPQPVNDPNRSYAPGSPERAELKARLKAMASEKLDIPLVIGGKEVRTGRTAQSVMPHDHKHVLADYHLAGPEHVQQAIAAAAEARREWGSWPWEDRAAVHVARGRAARDDVAFDAQCGDDAWAVEDSVSGRNRLCVGDDRLLALQRVLRAGAVQRAAHQRPRRLEPDGVPAARRVRLRDLAVQLHRDRRQPDDALRR